MEAGSIGGIAPEGDPAMAPVVEGGAGRAQERREQHAEADRHEPAEEDRAEVEPPELCSLALAHLRGPLMRRGSRCRTGGDGALAVHDAFASDGVGAAFVAADRRAVAASVDRPLVVRASIALSHGPALLSSMPDPCR
jgi:hypothetical protein